MKTTKDIIRWILLIICIVVGLLYLNGAFSSWWLSWGPPTEYPRSWEQQAVRRLGYSIALFFTGPMLFIALKHEFIFKKSIYKYVWLVVVILALTYPSAREFLLTDKCLDSGGAWDQTHFECTHE